jgi:hypothetical protein
MTVHKSITAIKINENNKIGFERAFVGIGGVIRCCSCGVTKCPREKGKVIRNYYQAIHLVATKGYACPICKTTFNGLLANIQTVKNWKRKFPQWSWKKMRIVERKN